MNYPIQTEGLSRSFGKTEALKRLDLSVPEGAVYAFLGPNGAGKTTTIKLLMNLLRPSAGTGAVLGTDSRALGPETLQQIGYVSENQDLPDWMTTVELATYARGFYPNWDRELSAGLLKLLDLPDDKPIRTFSRGMRMKAALATSLAYRPRVLILDEPFSGLDPLVRDEMVEAMLEIAGEGGQTVFVSSHDLSEIEHLADHVGFLRDGRLIASEQMDTLTGRFRQVDVITSGGIAVDAAPDWLQVERTENRIRFTHSSWSDAAEQELRGRVPVGSDLLVEPLTLRQIFVALAKQAPGRAS